MGGFLFRTVILHLVQRLARVLRQDLHVLHRVLVRERERFVQIGHDGDLAVVAPRGARERVGGEVGEEGVDHGHALPRDGLGVGDQDGGRVGAVLRLRQQVHRHGVGVRVLVRHDEDLRRPREEVDTYFAEELALGVRDEGVARSGDEVYLAHRLRAEGHGGDGLCAADDVDLVGACEVHGGDGRVRDLAGYRGRAGDDVADAGDFGG